LIFMPSQSRLSGLMQVEPANAAEWQRIRSESLLLAESSSALTLRPQSERTPLGKEYWNKASLEVRKFGTALYQAVQKEDFASAKKTIA